MRTPIFRAVMIPTVILFVLSGCAKKVDQTPPTKTTTAAPTDARPAAKAPSQSSTTPSAPAAGQATVPTLGAPAPTADARASNPTITQAPEKTMYLGQVLAAWNTGKRGDAVNQFLQLNWQNPAVFQGVPVLAMSEQQFAALPQAQRDAVGQQAQQLCRTARDLARAVIDTTDTFVASGNAPGAKSRLEAVRQFGQALGAPERLQIVQLVGKAITQLAQEKLSGIK